MAAEHLGEIQAVPIRMCVICRKRFPKDKLRRYVLSSEQVLILDANKTKPGRGWYVCSDQHCEQKFARFRVSHNVRRG
ncbi:MAG: DUF448 domain-containing protein [Desulfovibrionaceae bacterium]|nr:DUF448 domain-containing protein [Desulfovibrionaceae bacterium]